MVKIRIAKWQGPLAPPAQPTIEEWFSSTPEQRAEALEADQGAPVDFGVAVEEDNTG